MKDRPFTMLGGHHHLLFGQNLEGQYTTVIYGLIKNQRYQDAVTLLSLQLERHPQSRAVLSLLGFCYFHLEDYPAAVACYEVLLQLNPSIDEYQVYYAQSLYKAGRYPEAMRAAVRLDYPMYTQRMLLLQSAIKYAMEELPACKALLDQCGEDEPETLINHAAIAFKEGNYEDARLKYVEAVQSLGYQSDLAYHIALCHYKLKQYGPALKYIMDIIERGVQEHPELSVGSNADGIEVRSVGNSAVLQETYLIEAFNLKAAIEFTLKNMDAAREALSDMPPRLEEELDPVTLHNQALIHMEDDPANGFRKLNFLLKHPPFPPETFGNLLLLQCADQYYDVAAELLAENVQLAYKFVPQELYEYLDASIMVVTSPEEAYRRYDELTNLHIDRLRKLTKAIQDARIARDNEAIKQALKDYDEGLERYIPVLMAMARIYWNRGNYAMVEKLFRQSAEFCSEHDVWKLNVAHVFFMQESKWKEAIRYYDPIVQKTGGGGEQLLNVPAVVLANLCVSYIMTSQNEAAEELMRKIEKEEEERMLAFDSPHHHHHHHHHHGPAGRGAGASSVSSHLCIINLVIGTLYCAKGNFEFGITRVIKSLEPCEKKLTSDTWYYAKRCFLALIENLAKHLLTLKDAAMHEVLDFLDAVEAHGSKILVKSNTIGGSKCSSSNIQLAASSFSSGPLSSSTSGLLSSQQHKQDEEDGGGARIGKRKNETSRRTASYEAQQLKAVFIQLME